MEAAAGGDKELATDAVQMLSTMDYARLKKEYEGKASIPVTLGVPEGAQPDASLGLPLGKAVFWSVSEASRSG